MPHRLRPCLLTLALVLSYAHAAHAAAAQTARWTLTQELRIGSREGESALSRVSSLTVGRDGSIYVSQPLARAVWVFDARGRRLTDVGRRGNGPGEFQDPREVGRRGDSLWVIDASQRRVALFSEPDHAAVTITVRSGLSPVALLADGSVLARENPMAAEVGAGRVHTLSYYRLSRAGARLGVLTAVDLRHGWMFIRKPGSELPRTLRAQPFSDTRLVAASANGRDILVVDRPVATGSRGEFTVTHFDAAGRRTWSTRIPYTPRRLTKELIEDSIAPQARMIAEVPDFGATPATVAGWIRRLIYTPRNLPPVTAVVAGRDGTTWLRREPIRGAPARWMVLGAGGRVLATLEAPPGLRIMEADAQHVWGVVRDELDVPYVVVYRVRRGGSR